MLTDRRFPRHVATVFLPLVLIATGLFASVSVQAGSAPAANRADRTEAAAPFSPDYFAAPYNGSPISHGLGPTYDETWCAAPAAGSSIAGQQGAPLALIPYEAFGCLLQQFQDEADANDVPQRLTFGVNTLTDAGRTQYWAVVNAMETDDQIEGYNNWVAYRAKALTDPVGAQELLDSYTNVKIPVFMENNIHGDEEEGADSMMQIIRDLTTLPRGTNPTVDNFLDHAILITIPSMNPDGRFNGQRANQNGFDMNRDWLVQSQPEVRANLRLQVEWLAPVMFATHGYVNPTLVDSLTKPHNPGLEYDVFAYWNQRRVDENQKALARIGQGITRPVNGPLAFTVDKRTDIATATSVGTTATITTAFAHGVQVGATIVVAGVAEAGYNGTFTVLTRTNTTVTYTTPEADLPASSGGTLTGPNTTVNRGNCSNGNTPGPASNICGSLTIAAAPTGLAQSGTTVTVTTTTASTVFPPHVADTILVSGNPDGYNGGPFRVTSIISPTQFTYEAPASGLPASGAGTVSVQTGPGQAEGWDDLGPFYTQTYGAFWGVDGSTMEMCSNSCAAPFTGRLGGKTVQYVGFWSSADFWIANRDQILDDQVKIFVRGVNEAPRPNCCDDPLVASRGFTETEHDWMTEYPKAYIIPVGADVQRSDAEANRMAQWVLDNGILLRRATADFTWNGTTYPAGSYVVLMNQPLRGLAFTALGPGLDYSFRINQLYAPPGGWSHGLMWGADTVEVPNGAAFAPPATLITSVSELSGGVVAGAADWYAVKLGGVRDGRTILDLLRDGVYGEIAEAAFVNADGGPMPAGSIIFPNDPNTVAELDVAGDAGGLTFERGTGAKPTTTRLSEAPKVGILVNSANPAINDSVFSLRRIFGSDATFISVVMGANSIQNAADDPLVGIDVLYNTGQTYPAATNATARTRLNAFFARGGGYIATSQSAANFSFLTSAVPALVSGGGGAIAASPTGATSVGTTATITTIEPHNIALGARVGVAGVSGNGNPYNGTFTVQSVPSPTTLTYTIAGPFSAQGGGTVTTFFAGSAASFGGTAIWTNVGGVSSPLTSTFGSTDYVYLPSNVTYFGNFPAEATIDGQYLADMGSAANPRGPTAGYVAGLWLNRDSVVSMASNNAPMFIHGTTTSSSRYTGLATNPFSRADYERSWGWIVQSTLWSDLTDEALLDQTITADTLTDKIWGNADFPITATSTSGRSVSLAASGECTLDSPYSPAMIHITAAGTCTITASHPGDGNFNPAEDVVQTITIAQADASATYTGDPMASLAGSATSASILLQATVIDTALDGGLPDSGFGDIRTATVTFKEGATTLCGPLDVGLIGDSLATGAANCSVLLGIGSHTIDIVVDGNYTGTSQTTVVVATGAKGPASEVTGEGEFVFSNASSAGTYKADAGSTGKFQVTGKLDTSAPKGSAALTYKAGPKTYLIEMTSLSILAKAREPGGSNCDKAPSTTCAGLGYLRGTANLLDPTTKKPTVIGSGFTLQVGMIDRGKAADDSIAFTLWNGTTLLFSSEWDGAATQGLPLTKGNIAAN